MVRQVSDQLAAGQRQFTINSSNGGEVLSAAVIAGLIKGSDASLTVNGRCYSACALIVEATHATVAADADVQCHASAVQSTGRETNDAANMLQASGAPASLGVGGNLRRRDGSSAVRPPDRCAGGADINHC